MTPQEFRRRLLADQQRRIAQRYESDRQFQLWVEQILRAQAAVK